MATCASDKFVVDGKYIVQSKSPDYSGRIIAVTKRTLKCLWVDWGNGATARHKIRIDEAGREMFIPIVGGLEGYYEVRASNTVADE